MVIPRFPFFYFRCRHYCCAWFWHVYLTSNKIVQSQCYFLYYYYYYGCCPFLTTSLAIYTLTFIMLPFLMSLPLLHPKTQGNGCAHLNLPPRCHVSLSYIMSCGIKKIHQRIQNIGSHANMLSSLWLLQCWLCVGPQCHMLHRFSIIIHPC